MTVDPVVSYSDVYREFEYFFKRYRNDAKRLVDPRSLSALHSFLYSLLSRNRCLARVADDLGDDQWKRKPMSQIVPIEEHEAKITPEEVCLQERAMCSEQQLLLLGIHQLIDVSKMQQGIERMNWLMNSRKKRWDSVKESAKLCAGTAKSYRLENLADILEYHLKKLNNQIEVAR
jgi:hypothetical protein